jgi:hypothetical protein
MTHRNGHEDENGNGNGNGLNDKHLGYVNDWHRGKQAVG